MLTIGIPKNAHVLPGIMRLMKRAGLEPESVTPSLVRLGGMPQVQLITLKPKRLAILATRARVDAAILGDDALQEFGGPEDSRHYVQRLHVPRLGLRETRVVAFAHIDDEVVELKHLPQQAKVLSEYPRITRWFMCDEYNRSDLNIIQSPGGTEAEIPLLHRFGVCIVDSGRSLERHHLKEIGTIARSSPILMRSGYMPISDEKHDLLEKFSKKLRRTIELVLNESRSPAPELPDHRVFYEP
jgi:ATP phosphoribosyltransferase